MKRTWRGEILQLLPAAAMFVAAASCWSYVPNHMAVHWNLQGEADGFSGKAVGLLLLPLVSVGVYLLTLLLPLFDPGRANYQTFASTYNAIRISISLFLAAIYSVIVLVALGYRVDMNTVVGLALGVLFMVLGNVMGKIRPNWFVGVRTPWTLSSKMSWTKTHRLAGWLFIVMGLLAAAWGLLQTAWLFGLMLAVDGGFALLIIVYSYLVYRSDPSRTAPAGTTPGPNGGPAA
jgi:uncharacterized membrane protein